MRPWRRKDSNISCIRLHCTITSEKYTDLTDKKYAQVAKERSVCGNDTSDYQRSAAVRKIFLSSRDIL